MKDKKIIINVGQQTISILCKPEEEADIQRIAATLAKEINLLREQTGIPDRERLTIMAALLIINKIKDTDNSYLATNTLATIQTLNDKIDTLLERTQ